MRLPRGAPVIAFPRTAITVADQVMGQEPTEQRRALARAIRQDQAVTSSNASAGETIRWVEKRFACDRQENPVATCRVSPDNR